MRVEIELQSNLEAVAVRLAGAAGIDVETYLRDAIQEQLESTLATTAAEVVLTNKDAWKAQLRQWSDRHPRRTQSLDVSRDLMY